MTAVFDRFDGVVSGAIAGGGVRIFGGKSIPGALLLGVISAGRVFGGLPDGLATGAAFASS